MKAPSCGRETTSEPMWMTSGQLSVWYLTLPHVKAHWLEMVDQGCLQRCLKARPENQSHSPLRIHKALFLNDWAMEGVADGVTDEDLLLGRRYSFPLFLHRLHDWIFQKVRFLMAMGVPGFLLVFLDIGCRQSFLRKTARSLGFYGEATSSDFALE